MTFAEIFIGALTILMVIDSAIEYSKQEEAEVKEEENQQ
jgi:hypothetical protein